MELQELLDEMEKREPPRISAEEEDRSAPTTQAAQSDSQDQESPIGVENDPEPVGGEQEGQADSLDVPEVADAPSEELETSDPIQSEDTQLEVSSPASPEHEVSSEASPESPIGELAQGDSDYSPESPDAADVQPVAQEEDQELPVAQPEYADGLDGIGESLGDQEDESDPDLEVADVAEPEISQDATPAQPSFPSYDLPVSSSESPQFGSQESPIGYEPPVTFGGTESAEITQPASYSYGSNKSESFKNEREPFDNNRFISDLGAELSPKFDELAYSLSANAKDFVNQRVLEITMLGDF